MTESKTKKSIRNIAWGLGFKSLSVILPFISRTIIIRIIGIEYVGLGSLFTALLTVLSLAELGISESIIFSMYKPLAEGDEDKVSALLNIYRKAYWVIGLVILVIGLLLLIRIDIFVQGSPPEGMNLRILFLIYLLNTVASYFSFSYLSVVLTANQRNDVEYKISSAICLIREIIQITALLLFKDYYIYIAILPIMTLVHNVWRAIRVKKLYPQFKPRGRIDAETKSTIKRQIGGLMIGKITVASRNSFDSIIISIVLGLTSVAIYSNYFYIMNSIYGFLIYFTAAIRGGIGNNVATLSPQKNYEDMLNLSELFWWIYGVCTVILFCLYQPFMVVWVGKEMTYDFLMVILFSLYFYLICTFLIFSQYLEAKGLFWENKWRYILEAVSNLVLNILLVKILGIHGIILATIFSVLVLTNIYGPIIGFKHYFKDCNFKTYIFRQLFNLLLTVGCCGAVYYLCSIIPLRGIWQVVVNGAVSLVASVLIFILFKFKTKAFKDAKNYLFTRLKNKG